MTNLIVLPILIPLITAVFLIFFQKQIILQRWISAISTTGLLITSIIIVQKVRNDGVQSLDIGSWAAPFGITLVSDMLSALLILTTSIIALACLFYSFRSIGRERENFYYYPVFQFLLVGVIGAFSTGDIFNLFVFFEVMLMSSYVLLVLGGRRIQLRESIKYLTVNIISSALFVIAVAFLYSAVGTLNMAHISKRIAEIGQPGIITVVAVLFLIVFGLKGAIFPLYFWLPGSYYAPPIPVMALFGALLTKVGVYSITRTYTLLFYHDTGFTHELLLILSIITIVAGVIGAIAYWDVKKIIIYNIITAIGIITFGISLMSETALQGSIYYLIHDMIIKAALFLIIGIIISITNTSSLRKMSGLIKSYPLLGWSLFIAAISLAGIPPFSGFIGKLFIIQAGFESGSYIGSFVVLFSSLFVLYSVMKIFINGFWGIPKSYSGEEKLPYRSLLLPSIALVAISVAYGLGVEYINPYVTQAVEVLTNPDLYIKAVLKE